MLKQWWLARSSREQLILTSGSIIVVILLAYLFIWAPISVRTESLRQSNIENRLLLNWMDSATRKIQQYQQLHYQKHDASSQALLVTVEQSLLKAQLSKYVRNTQTQADNQVTLTFSQVPFDQMIDWVEQLWKQHNIIVGSASIKKANNNGLTDVTINLLVPGT